MVIFSILRCTRTYKFNTFKICVYFFEKMSPHIHKVYLFYIKEIPDVSVTTLI